MSTKTRLRPMRVIKLLLLAGATVVSGVLVIQAHLGSPWVHVAPELIRPHAPYAPQCALALFLFALALWVTAFIPLAATSLLVLALLPVLGVSTSAEAFASFGNRAVFFILGVFFLAAAMITTGLSKRLTHLMLQRFDRRPMLLVAGVGCSASFLSFWMPAHAVAAMMYPIILEIAEALELGKGKSNYGRMLFLSLAWGAIVGSMATFLGGARAPIANELLRAATGGEAISFVHWMIAALPLVVVLTGAAIVLLRLNFKPEVKDIRKATVFLDAQVRAMGRMSLQERRLTVLALTTVVAWIFFGARGIWGLDLAVIALIAAVLLFALRIAQWQRLVEYVNWGVILMYGGAIALAGALQSTHVMHWFVERLLPAGDPAAYRFGIIAGLAAVAILLTEGISNAAAVAVLLPAGFALCDQAGIDKMTMTLAITLPAGMAFSLPMGSPPNAICYFSGYYGVRQVLRVGVQMTIVSYVCFLLVVKFYWPLIGLGL